MKNYNAVLTLISDINKVFADVTEDDDKIEPLSLNYTLTDTCLVLLTQSRCNHEIRNTHDTDV